MQGTEKQKDSSSALWEFIILNSNRLIFWLSLQRSFFSAKSVHIFLFVVVNVFIGSLGVWMPLMTSLFLKDVRFSSELSASLSASGPYTFAVAYLAASSAYIAYDFLESRTSPNRKIKTVFGTTAFVLIILCTLLSAFQTQISHLAVTSGPPAAQHSLPTEASLLVSSKDKSFIDVLQELHLSSAEQLQLWLVAISVLVGLVLYVLSRWDDEDCNRMVEEYEKTLTDAAQELSQKARSSGETFGDLKV
jgi:hypothetical protein